MQPRLRCRARASVGVSEGCWRAVSLMCSQKRPGERGFLMPRLVDGKKMVMLPEMLVGLMLEMVSGSERTPKGGISELLAVHDAEERGMGEVVDVKEKTGTYGRGAYADEPWSTVAIRKRLTTVRKFYASCLEGTKEDVNPGWQPIVKSTMISITLLLGTSPKHVRARRSGYHGWRWRERARARERAGQAC